MYVHVTVSSIYIIVAAALDCDTKFDQIDQTASTQYVVVVFDHVQPHFRVFIELRIIASKPLMTGILIYGRILMTM